MFFLSSWGKLRQNCRRITIRALKATTTKKISLFTAILSSITRIWSFKATWKKWKKPKLFWWENFSRVTIDCAFKRDPLKSRGKKTKSFGGKIVLRKKGLRFWMVSGLGSKYTKSFGGKICATDLSHQQSKYMFDFWLDSVVKCRTFFLVGNPT